MPNLLLLFLVPEAVGDDAAAEGAVVEADERRAAIAIGGAKLEKEFGVDFGEDPALCEGLDGADAEEILVGEGGKFGAAGDHEVIVRPPF
jgi:hypothetical protein